MQFETVNHKMRAAELRATAAELARRGFHILAEVNNEEAEWLDPTPREKPLRDARRTRQVNDQGEGVPQMGVNHRGTGRQTTRSDNHRTPRGTSVVGRTSTGRTLRQTGAN